MAAAHLDRLSAIDASFLAQERGATHMHIGAVALVEGPPPAIDAVTAHVYTRLGFVPRYRQKLAFPPLDTGRPLWVDDPTFNLGYHLRHTALAPPGDEAALLRLASRIFSQQLDRAKPLWELYVVEGLADGRFALISKSHHALVDGISGLDIASVIFDSEAAPARGGDRPAPWIPEPEPTPAQLAALGMTGAVRRGAQLAGDAVGSLGRPGELARRVRDVATGLAEVIWEGLRAAPETPYNVTPGSHRRIAVVRAELDELRAIKDALGGTVNDVILAIVTGGLAYHLQTRGRATDDLELKACVPISVRTEADKGRLGNQLTEVYAPLPVFLDDPVARLRYVRNAMAGLKDSKQALGAEAITALSGFAPPTILAQASRLNLSGRLYNLLVANIPGPQTPLYLLGRRLDAMMPLPFLAGDRALAIAAMSYDGGVTFGLLGDFDALSDLGVLAEGMEGSIAELVIAAERAGPRRRRTPRSASARLG
jgi:WS/DGAT/MGAT family acyltransferase